MNAPAECYQLFVPRSDQIPELIQTNLVLCGLTQESLLLLDYFVVVSDGLRIWTVQGDHAAIQKTPTRLGTAADNFELVRREPHGMQLGHVTPQRFAFAVDKCLFGICLNCHAQFPVNRVATMNHAANDCA